MNYTIRINNQDRETSACDLLQLSEELQLPEKGVAIAVNGRILPRGEWRVYLKSTGQHYGGKGCLWRITA